MSQWKKSKSIFLNIDVPIFSPESYRPIEEMTFPDGSINIRIPDDFFVDKEIENNALSRIIFRYQQPSDLVALTLFVNAISQYQNLADIVLIIPYMPYSRQDRICNAGEANSIKAIASLIDSLGFGNVVTFDPHSDVTPAVFKNLQVVNQETFLIEMGKCLQEYSHFVSPDAGANKKVFALAQKFKKDLICLDKHRDVKTGEITSMNLITRLTLPPISKALIIDDICDGGRTFIEASKVMAKEFGINPSVDLDLFVTHGFFTKGFDVFKGHLNTIYYTNSLLQNMKASIIDLNIEIIDTIH